MKTSPVTRISVALIGFAALMTLFASPASAGHRYRHYDHHHRQHHSPCHWY